MKTALTRHTVCASKEVELIPITETVRQSVLESGVQNGVAFIISAHTTCGITMNEGLPCVETDIVDFMDKLVPADGVYTHAHFLPSYGATGGNSPGHLKSMLCGNHCVMPVENGALVLGHAQDIYFAEWDGIKNRQYFVQVMGE